MKNVYLFSNKLKLNILAIALCSAFAVVSSCKDEEESPFEDVTVQFAVQTLDSVALKAVITQVGVEQSQNFDVPGQFVFLSLPRVVNTSAGALHVASTANGFDADSELVVKILVNGQLKASDTVRGVGNLVAKTQYNFIE